MLEASYDNRTIQELLGHMDVSTTMIYTHVLNRGGLGYTARSMDYSPVYTDFINREQQLAYGLKDVDMTEFRCDTRSHGHFLYGKKQFVFTVLYRLYNYCYVDHGD